MSNIPADLRYTKEHEWVRASSGKNFHVGITDYAQSALGDIVYIQLPKVGDSVTQGKVCGEVESTKSVSEIYAPLTGKIIAVNSSLDSAPEVLNTDPYGAGWIFEVEVNDDAEVGALLTSVDYQSLVS
ncbi:MAG: glycine cleavage system protein GcvH [Actinobacteria bacterium]|jgi:glycine cleavage system H protein|nr:glycine cleavage system protein GcvH [Actinomycetota bacterium]NCU89251.1 glycine cleavage system protein GcvH [Actinomycetota bacterium]NDA96033.1 glycine cleavage system protein GcvH [Actinomycetota bacterium]